MKMALRGTEFGDWAWEYDAPQFVDFSKLSCSDLINDEDYFNVDHEQRNPVSKKKAFKTVEKNELQVATASPGTEGKKPMELTNVSKIKQEPDTEFHDCKTDVEFKENVGESSSNLLDSTCGFSKLPDINSKSLKLNDVFQPPSSVGKIQAVTSLEKTQGQNHDHGSAAPYSFGMTCILEDTVSSKLSNNGMEGTAHNVLCPIKTTLPVVGKEVVSASDAESDDNEVCALKIRKTSGDRGRTMNRNCRQVDDVTSAKKRLSMSVDRGRDRLRLLSPSPPLHREGSLEIKENLAVQKSELPSANQKSHGKGICHSLVFHKSRSVVRSQTIVESQSEMTVDEKEFVRGLTENNLEAVEDERLNRTGVVPHTGVPFQLLGTQRVTLTAPFSFEQRTKQMLVKKEEKIRKILETERKAREFHAQPFPDIIYSAAQPKKRVRPAPKPPTKPVPFQLHQPNPTLKPAAEPKQTFRAKPAKVLHMEPFVPQKSAQRKTDFVPLSLSTKQRAEKRAEWDRLKQEKEVQTGQERVVKERQRKEQDDQELRKLRAATVHKANPIRYYKPVAVVPSTKPSTIPKSPTLSHRSNAS